MTFFQKHKLVPILLLVAILLSGLIFGFLLGKNANVFQDLFAKEDLYQASCSIYVGKDDAPASSLSASDLSIPTQILDSLAIILETQRSEIQEAFPDTEFNLALESVENTCVFYLHATCKDPSQAKEICNMAVSLLLEESNKILDSYSCKAIEYAKQPTTPIN